MTLSAKSKPYGLKKLLRVASSNSLYLSSQAHVLVVVKHLMLNLSHSSSVTECILQTQQVVHQSGAVQLLHHLTQQTHEGKGPAWSNSLFEDNAEFGLGMATSS